MKRTVLTSLVLGVALSIAPAAQALVLNDGSGTSSSTIPAKYVAGVTNFPAAHAVKVAYVGGVTDFPSAVTHISTPSAPASVAQPTNGGIQWGDATIGAAVALAIGLAMLGSTLLMRRRQMPAHS